jgi:predicted Zn-dependent protease
VGAGEALAAARRGEGARAEEEARRAVAEAPADPVGRAALALALLAGRRPREAVPEAEAASRLAPGRVWALRLRSAALREAGRPRESVLAAEEAVRIDPADPGAQVAHALALLAAGRAGTARRPLERTLALRPDDPVALRLLGHVALARDPVEAESLFRRSLRADPTSVQGRVGLARALFRQGRTGEGEEVFRAAAAADPAVARDRESRRRAVLQLVPAAAAAFLTALLLQAVLLPRAVAGSPWFGVLAWLSALFPAAALAWAAVRLRRARAGGPLDPEVEALAAELLEGAGNVARGRDDPRRPRLPMDREGSG